MGRRKKIDIDPDLWEVTRKYVHDQLVIMDQVEVVTGAQLEHVIYDCARHPQEIRNLIRQAEKKATREAARRNK
jgi:hypothetical protein